MLGRTIRLDGAPDWHRDPRTGARFDSARPAAEIDLVGDLGAAASWGAGTGNSGICAPDPRGAWELSRAGHLVELCAAAALHRDLAPAARALVARHIGSFLDENPLGRGLHWCSPLEVALRAIHWLAALDLLARAGAPLDWDGTVGARVGGSLVEHGRFLAANLEERGAVPANHLLGDLAGLAALGLRLGSVAEAPRWRQLALARLPVEARRQVEPDGADFEASTAYHRFALELLAAADHFAAAAGVDAGLGDPLGAMYRYVAGYLDPEGREPGFGDGDEGRCLPLAARDPHSHAYLLAVGAARTGDPLLKREEPPYAEEAVWLHGAAGWRRYRALPSTRPPRAISFPGGGMHVVRGDGAWAAMRAGGYGQHGVGGHAHNDQLAVVVHLGGAPLLVDAGTLCYVADAMWRDRFRGTAAHSTVVVEGQEQSELFDERPFALPDAARGRLLSLDDRPGAARVIATHRGYLRLPQRVVHRRELLVDSSVPGRPGMVVITDTLDGRGVATIECRLHLGERAARSATAGEVARVAALLDGTPWADRVVGGGIVVALADEGHALAALVPLADTPPLEVVSGWCSPRWGDRRTSTVVRWITRGRLPCVGSVALVALDSAEGGADEGVAAR